MRRSAVHTVLVLVFCSMALAAETPVAVSPGDTSKLALIGDTCPTFSWGSVEGARSYELVVYRLGDDSEEAKPVLQETFAGSASSWTPSLDRCLERGGQYAWSVRAIGGSEASEWSAPSLFEVAAGPSEAEFEELLALVKRYPAQVASGAPDTPLSANRAVPGEVGPEVRTSIAGPPPSAGATTSGVRISQRGILIRGRPVAVVEGKIVFVTSTPLQGNLGGLAGADAICNSLAGAAGLAGSYKAWLSSSGCGPATPCRGFTQSAEPYVQLDGRRIADDWADLTDGAIQLTPRLDENGNSAGGVIWTNTRPDGTPDSTTNEGHCLNWITNSDSFIGLTGTTTPLEGMPGAWSKFFQSPCSGGQVNLYCFEQ